MTERIDHEARALEALSHVPKDGTVEQALAVAQVAATLALAEHQRTANLIAFSMMPTFATERYGEAIREALRL